MASNAVKSLHELAEAARHELMQCQFALDDAAAPRERIFLDRLIDRFVRLPSPIRLWKLHRARKHRAAARELIARLHTKLHDTASLGRHNADLWMTIMRGVDALSTSRWLNTDALGKADVAPARATVHIILGDLSEVVGHLHELQWPGEAPSSS
ncbi:MAG: hypothetical protein HOV81_34060 [Kofleriaceae bacterium]|nr:hypothetical protein [Kofleriaceae bacterium]